MNNRVYNFSAGPGVIFEDVLKKAADEMMNQNGSGMSVMEMSHRSKWFEDIINGAEALLREVMAIPDNYKVLFLQGGASSQFAMIPMNLKKNGKADYIQTGVWAKKSYQEAKKFIDCRVVASSEDKTYTYIPETKPEDFNKEADYVHFCYNNTIYGTKFNGAPDVGGIDLVCDMSSCILSEPVDVSKYALIYAGAQKNMGPAGLTVVIVREDLIREDVEPYVPVMFRYKTHADNGSMYNTPPTYAIYICKLVLEKVKELGGLEAMKKINEQKAAMLYDFLDSSKLFRATVSAPYRSLMNVPFVTGDKELDAKFIKEATEAGFVNLKGHRSVGGMRASLYNAMPIEGVAALVGFMKDFERKNA